MKNTGVLLPTRSQSASSVENFIANPRGSRTVSALPNSPATGEKRTDTGLRSPTFDRNAAFVPCVTSAVTSKKPCAALPLACATRFATGSRLKCCISAPRGVLQQRRTVRANSPRMLIAGNWHPDAFLVRCSAMEPKLRSSSGASKPVRERLIVTRDRSRWGAVATESGAVLGAADDRAQVRAHVPGQLLRGATGPANCRSQQPRLLSTRPLTGL